jgi:hypothetical protein
MATQTISAANAAFLIPLAETASLPQVPGTSLERNAAAVLSAKLQHTVAEMYLAALGDRDFAHLGATDVANQTSEMIYRRNLSAQMHVGVAHLGPL